MRRLAPLAAAALATIAWPTGAAAAPPEDEAANDWKVSATTYVWFSGLEGKVGVSDVVQPVKVDMSFGDILDNLKLALTGFVQARKGRVVLAADLSYVAIGIDRGIGVRERDFAEAELDTSTFTGTGLAGYQVADSGPVSLDLLAGARINAVDTDLQLQGPARTFTGEVSKTWVDPVIAANLGVPLGSRTTLAIYGDVGGFGVASDLTWQLAAGLQHDLSRRWRISGGWRHYAVDYDNGSFLYDVALSGPIAGVRYSF